MSSVGLTVVVPAYNRSGILDATLAGTKTARGCRLKPHTAPDPERTGSFRPAELVSRKRKQIDTERTDRYGNLANRLHGFDRDAGYPMAWYFHLLAAPGEALQIIPAVLEDHAAGYDYLPPADLDVLRRWRDDPYALV